MIAFLLAAALTQPKVAVIEFEVQKGLRVDRIYFSDKVRQLTRKTSPPYFVMTRESTDMLLAASGTSLEKCADEGKCEVELGRTLGADFVVSGRIARVGSRIALTMRLFRTATGELLDSEEVLGHDEDALVDGSEAKIRALLAALPPATGTEPAPAAQAPQPARPAEPPLAPQAAFGFLRMSEPSCGAEDRQKRQQMIATLQTVLASKQSSTDTADLLFRLAEERWDDARCSKDASRARSAIDAYRKVLVADPGYSRADEVEFMIAWSTSTAVDAAEGARLFSGLIERYPQSKFVPDAYVELGVYSFSRGDLAQARSAFEHAAKTNAPEPAAAGQYGLGWCDFRSGDLAAALAKFEAAAKAARGPGLRKAASDAANAARSALTPR